MQKIINREDWEPGNAIAFVITGSGKRTAKAFQGKKEEAPQLVVEADLPKEPAPEDLEHPHTVRLYFSEPNGVGIGHRVFDVTLQGKTVEEDLDVVREAGYSRSTIVREYANVMAARDLTIKLSAKKGRPILNGVEISREEKK